jgi:hypothetical protein
MVAAQMALGTIMTRAYFIWPARLPRFVPAYGEHG